MRDVSSWLRPGASPKAAKFLSCFRAQDWAIVTTGSRAGFAELQRCARLVRESKRAL